MVLKRLWRLFKKAFGKKRRSVRRHRKKPRVRPRKKINLRRKRASVKRPITIKKAKPLKKPAATKPKVAPRPKGVFAGTITHYFPRVNAAVIQLKKPLHVGEPIFIKGPKTQIRQTVGSMQIDRVPIEKAKAGQEIGLEVFKEVRPGDIVYLVKE